MRARTVWCAQEEISFFSVGHLNFSVDTIIYHKERRHTAGRGKIKLRGKI